MDVVCLTYSVAYENRFFKVQRFVMFKVYFRSQKRQFLVIPPPPSQELIPQENHTCVFTMVKTITKVVSLFRFSIFMHILFIHVDAETFVPLLTLTP